MTITRDNPSRCQKCGGRLEACHLVDPKETKWGRFCEVCDEFFAEDCDDAPCQYTDMMVDSPS